MKSGAEIEIFRNVAATIPALTSAYSVAGATVVAAKIVPLLLFLNARCYIAIILTQLERWKFACQQQTEIYNNKNMRSGTQKHSYKPQHCFHCRLHIDFDRLICCLLLIESAGSREILAAKQQQQLQIPHYIFEQLRGTHWRATGKFIFPKREISIDTRGQCQQRT